jgi:hypothetical protein
MDITNRPRRTKFLVAIAVMLVLPGCSAPQGVRDENAAMPDRLSLILAADGAGAVILDQITGWMRGFQRSRG